MGPTDGAGLSVTVVVPGASAATFWGTITAKMDANTSVFIICE